MTTTPLPGEIDPARFCRVGESLEFNADVAAFPRLAAEFTQGALACRIAGAVDAMGPYLKLEVEGAAGLTCQRCLGPMMLPIALVRTVRLARDDLELNRLDADLEFDAIPLTPKLDPVALVEDEILLSLPLAAMHEPDACPARASGV